MSQLLKWVCWVTILIAISYINTSCVGCSNVDSNIRADERSLSLDNRIPVDNSRTVVIYGPSTLPEAIHAEVIGIQDGDTIELKVVYEGPDAKERSGKNLRIRFMHIDCPEKGAAYFKDAKRFTSDACFSQVVAISHHHEFDRYGRLIGEVILSNGDTLNRELVKLGLATHYKEYSNDQEYAQLENMAQGEGLGIWSQR